MFLIGSLDKGGPMYRLLSTALLCVFVGCAKNSILEKNADEIDEYGKAKYITELVNVVEQGLVTCNQLESTALEERVEILETIYPYGKKAVQVVGIEGARPHIRFIYCASALAFHYDLFSQQKEAQAKQAGGDSGLKEEAKAYKRKAYDAANIAIQMILRYQKLFYDMHPHPPLYDLLEQNYELIGDYENAYYVTRRWLDKLEVDVQAGNVDPSVKQSIEKWKTIKKKLENKFIDNLQPVPEYPPNE